MKFTKMQGIGNDYVYVDCFQEQVPDPAQTAVRVSNRHFGIGSDGLILICPSEIADCRMRMYNEDGSEGLMCGNGIRCVGKYVYDHGIVNKPQITVETADGIKTLELQVEQGRVVSARVDMGVPELTSKLPEAITVAGRSLSFTGISVGNPHAVYYLDVSAEAGAIDGVKAIDGVTDIDRLDLERIGSDFENHERFPDRVNTEFVQVLDRGHLKMRVWERGSGETMACGTGATACAVASMMHGLVDDTVEVQLRGGNLTIFWDRESGHVFMTGPAVEVYHGEIEL